MIYNKSGHPVEVKKISIRLWSLRDEIEAALGRRMKECEAAGVPLYIEDIKKFYNLNAPTSPDNVFQLKPKDADGDAMASLMESVAEEAKEEAAPQAAEGTNTLNEAEEIIAEQTMQGLETKKPNPILERPYQRQAPDLNKVSYGFVLLSDINMESILSFTKDKFLQGQSVVVEFLIPQNFMMTADVTYCHHYAMRSRIISSTKPDYRLQCKFAYAIPGERENLRNFLKSIEPTIAEKKSKKEDDSLGI
ncbi:hypothetical protein ACJVC5_14830 [Peredibacter sp. HCB2-198]|uniref:hypothetical protein n=1 Tax=Peredibacter sp. HCB2-198 TaxID=3383025 RepID=UPI0038B6AC4A